MGKLKYALLGVIIILLGLASSAGAQGENRMTEFNGGKMNLSLSLSGGLFSGMGATASALGGTAAIPEGDASSLYWNPAGLSFMDRGEFLLDLGLPLSVDLSRFVDLDSKIADATDGAIEDYKSSDLDPSYTQLSPSVAFLGGIRSGALVIPFAYFVVGGCVSRPLDLDLQLVGNGITTLLEIEKEMGGDTKLIRFRSAIDLYVLSQIRIGTSGLAIAMHPLAPQWGVGVSLDRYDAKALIDGKFRIDGIMEMAGQEFVFNDPYDARIDTAAGEQNDLNQAFVGSYQGSGWGIKVGTIYRLSERLAVAANLNLPPKLKLTGTMEIEDNTIPALNKDVLLGEGEGDLIDPTQLDLSALTKTEPFQDPTGEEVLLNLPGYFNLGISFRRGFTHTVLDYSHYFGALSYEYLQYTGGLKLKDSIRLGFDLKYLRLGLGMITWETVDGEGGNIPLPIFNLGTGFSLWPTYRVDLLLSLLPLPTLRVSTTYTF